MPSTAAVVVTLASGGIAGAAVLATVDSPVEFSSVPDWTAPTVEQAILGDLTGGGMADHIHPGHAFRTYITDHDNGNPPSGTSSVRADLSAFAADETTRGAVSGSHAYADQPYGRRSAIVTADAASRLTPCRVTYTLAAKDIAGNRDVTTRHAMVDRDLLADYGLRLEGGEGGESRSGAAVSGAGDVNADGRPDAIIAAPAASPHRRTAAGSVYVVFGQAVTTTVDLNALGADGVRIDGGVAFDRLGTSVAGAGDLNADGLDDVVIGAPDVNAGGLTNSGAVYVVFGRADGATIDVASLGSAGYRVDGALANDEIGQSVAAGGDANGDGRKDILLGSVKADGNARTNSGAAWVIFGTASPANVELAALGTAGYRLDGPAAYDELGGAVANAGDIDGDGRADAVIGAAVANPSSGTDAGSVFVVSGRTSSTPVDLGSLGSGGYRINGAVTRDYLGTAVAPAGDVNLDGIPDVLVGAPGANNNSKTDSGSAYVIFGKTSTTAIETSSLGSAGYRIDGVASYDNAGAAVAGAGDVNGDGRPDAVLGAPQADANGRTDSGSAYVVFGRSTTTALKLSTLGAAGYSLAGANAGDAAGSSVAAAGDTDADGRPDVLVGSPLGDEGHPDAGTAYVMRGTTDTTPVDMAAPGSSGYAILGAVDGDEAGHSVAGAGDVNGDGQPDAIIGAPAADRAGANEAGAGFVLFGRAASSPESVDLTALGTAGFRIVGAATGDGAGTSVAGAGDVNGDGLGDVLIGAPGANPGGTDSGAAYVVFGRTASAAVDLGTLGADGYEIDGAGAGDGAGSSVSSAGDLNADGAPDALVGSPEATGAGRSDAGLVHIIFGKTTTAAVNLATPGAAAREISGAAAYDHAGSSVAAAGDVNGDDRPDLLIGAPGANSNGRTNAGSAYVVYGDPASTPIDLAALAADGLRIDGAAAYDELGSSVANAGDVSGDGRPDPVVGAPRANPAERTNAGSTFVVHAPSTGQAIDLATEAWDGVRYDGATSYDESGTSVSRAGDVNDDGTPDLLIGAPLANNAYRTNSGSAYVLFGGSQSRTVDLDDLRFAGYRIDGAAPNDNAGRSVAALGDVDGDGRPDLAMGAPGSDPSSRTGSGSTYLGFGPPCDTSPPAAPAPTAPDPDDPPVIDPDGGDAADSAGGDSGAPGSSPGSPGLPGPSSSLDGSLLYTRTSNPATTRVTDRQKRWLATFTDGARTVRVAGPKRTFNEATAPAPVITSTWVRVLPEPFDGTVDETWLRGALGDSSPDILRLATQYVQDAPPLLDGDGMQIAGDADYGPLQPDDTRQEGADFNDYLGVPWTYGSTVDQPETAQLRSLDCSGFIRMIWGYRSGMPLTLGVGGVALPRRAVQMLAGAPGVVTVQDDGTQVTDLTGLQIGDLVFFDADVVDGTAVDHVGTFIGRDTLGSYRFVSSRKSINGPTLGDYRGASILNGSGLYARAFRAVRRL